MSEKLKQYRITKRYYRAGVTFEPGSVVSVPASERPAKDWEEVGSEKAPAAAAPAPVEKEQSKAPVPAGKDGKRANDKDVA